MSDHASVAPNTLIAGRFRVLREAGTGNFARVFVCADVRKSNTLVAVKLLKRGYERDAEFERDVLTAINRRDPDDRHNVVKMLAFFKWNEHPCFAFGLKGASLKYRLAAANCHRLSRVEVVSLAKDLAEALLFLHSTARIIHTDLKPENLLLDESGPTPRWTVCDFGSASFVKEGRPDSDLISTRPYRAPEVVLGSEWTAVVDMWSVGCILYECRTGSKLFDATTDEVHLALMEHHLGSVADVVVRKGSSKVVRQCFDSERRLRMACPRGADRKMSEVLREDPEFLDLMMSLLRYEPHFRMKPQDMLRHPFVLDEPVPPANRIISPIFSTGGISWGRQTNTSPGNDNSPGSEATSSVPSPSYRDPVHNSTIQHYGRPSPLHLISPLQHPQYSPSPSQAQPIMLPSKFWPRDMQPRAAVSVFASIRPPDQEMNYTVIKPPAISATPTPALSQSQYFAISSPAATHRLVQHRV